MTLQLTSNGSEHWTNSRHRAARAVTTSRRLVYSTDPVEVALDIRHRGRDANVDVDGKLSLKGRFFPERDINAGGFRVQLLEGSSPVAASTTDSGGSFTFRAVAPGRYSVHLHTDRLGITIKPVKVSAVPVPGTAA